MREVEVLTTCARDYVTWRNELPPGAETINGVTVRRFPVRRPRDAKRFGRWSARVFEHTHSIARRAEVAGRGGPDQPDARRLPGREPAALRLLPVLQLPLLPRVSRRARGAGPGRARADRRARSRGGPRAVRADVPRRPRRDVQLARRARPDHGGLREPRRCPGLWSACGSEVPARAKRARFRQKYGLDRPLRDLRRTDRREQGLRRAVRALRALRAEANASRCRSSSAATRSCRSPTARASGTSGS